MNDVACMLDINGLSEVLNRLEALGRLKFEADMYENTAKVVGKERDELAEKLAAEQAREKEATQALVEPGEGEDPWDRAIRLLTAERDGARVERNEAMARVKALEESVQGLRDESDRSLERVKELEADHQRLKDERTNAEAGLTGEVLARKDLEASRQDFADKYARALSTLQEIRKLLREGLDAPLGARTLAVCAAEARSLAESVFAEPVDLAVNFADAKPAPETPPAAPHWGLRPPGSDAPAVPRG